MITGGRAGQDNQSVVHEIQTRTTLIQTSSGFLVVIPRPSIYREKVTIDNAYDLRRAVFEIHVGKDTDTEASRSVLVDGVQEVEGVLEAPVPSVVFVGVAGNRIKLRAGWWADARRVDETKVGDQVIPAITRRLGEHNLVCLPSRARWSGDCILKRGYEAMQRQIMHQSRMD